MGLTASGRNNGGSGHRGGGYLFRPYPEHSLAVHCDQTHYVFISGGVSAPVSTSFPAVVVIGMYGPGGVVGGI